MKLWLILRQPSYAAAFARYRVAAGVEHAPVLRNLGEVHTVLDIGANRGQFSLVARRAFPGGIIHAFEPLREPAKVFLRVFAGDEKVKLYSCGIGPERADATIHVSFDDDSSSLLPIGEAQTKLFPRTAQKEIRAVSVLPLGDLLDAYAIHAPALLKIDVQGYELEALRGCEPLLDRFHHVYVECSFIELYEGQALASEVIAYLAKHGFRLIGVYNMCYDRKGHAIQGDFLFSMREQVQVC